ncbi:hypothetical protein V2P58_00620 [Mycoplasma capricolum subsp. capricolum]|uniref:Transmembrane protein n=1 Tax=Mycoplasma capricolum subsp. capricolum TaxID=40479 RepID=A0A0C2ZL82_MYCCA|nr:hypothetical protein [Mycoplasma capricolum]KIM13660.1 hypothetical protein MCGM508_01015 [Mycoplasma capricolum subsp. capricolum]KKW61705.1 hypothetical protein AAK27_72 [Mycoplasma capricolum subsp. capricolum]MCK8462047.1 hypothetical protein [Mycoplasma capricolum subsp. capricolum]
MQNKTGLSLLEDVFINNYYNKIDFIKMIFSKEQINQLNSITNLNQLLIDLKQLLEQQKIINQNKISDYYLQLKQTNKKILNKLWLWWLLPVIGMFIFFIIYNNRLQNPYYANQLVDIKVKITDLEVKNIYITKLIDEILNNN